MDAAEIRNRTVSTVISAFAAAATTASFLYMFQDSSDTVASKKKSQGQSKISPNAGKDVVDLNGPIARGIPKVGDASMLFPDFVGGLNTFASKARSTTTTGLGEFTFQNQIPNFA
jgi:hypothetical protein